MIVATEERVHFVELHGLQVGDLADRGPVVRMIRREERGEQRHRRETVRAVLVVLAALVQHDVALVRELCLRERRQQEAHAVRFHPQGELEGVGRHHFPVVRTVGVGRSVERRAGALQRLEEAAIVMLRPLEHQMLEQVRETGMSRMFVLRSDVVPDVDRDDRTPVILVQEHVESIAQRVLRVRQLHLKLPHDSIELP